MSALEADVGSVSIAAALQSLALFEERFEGILVTGAIPNSDYDAGGNLYDTIDVSFEIIGRPGLFTVSVPFAINWQAIAFYYIGLKAQQVEQIFEGLPDKNTPPTQLLVQVPTASPTPIPRPGAPLPV